MWCLTSCLLLHCRTKQERWRILPCSASPIPLVQKGNQGNQNPVSIPIKIQCDGGINLRLTTSSWYGTLHLQVCHDIVHPSVPSWLSYRGWLSGHRSILISKRLEVFLAWCTCSALGCGWAEMVSEALPEKGGRESLFRIFSCPRPGSHYCLSNINWDWVLLDPNSASMTKQGLESCTAKRQRGLCPE